jgi:hypothetical protein
LVVVTAGRGRLHSANVNRYLQPLIHSNAGVELFRFSPLDMAFPGGRGYQLSRYSPSPSPLPPGGKFSNNLEVNIKGVKISPGGRAGTKGILERKRKV